MKGLSFEYIISYLLLLYKWRAVLLLARLCVYFNFDFKLKKSTLFLQTIKKAKDCAKKAASSAFRKLKNTATSQKKKGEDAVKHKKEKYVVNNKIKKNHLKFYIKHVPF